MSVSEKLSHFSELDIEVAGTNLQTKSHLFEVNRFCGAPTTLLIFHLLVLIFAPIDNFGNWRICVRGDLYEIELCLSCGVERIFEWHYPELFAV